MKGKEILELLDCGELADAEHEMSELAGIDAEQHEEVEDRTEKRRAIRKGTRREMKATLTIA